MPSIGQGETPFGPCITRSIPDIFGISEGTISSKETFGVFLNCLRGMNLYILCKVVFAVYTHLWI